jgi:O-antigen/teichoic acid export membrane protein
MNLLKSKVLFLKKNTFLSNIINVAFGNGFGKLLAIAVTPLLTNLYSPIEFGELSLFISITSIIGVFTTLRYSTAIPLEKDNNYLINLIFLCFVLVIILGILTSSIFYLINLFFPNKFNNVFSILICISIFGKGFYEILSNWCVKEKKFKLITKSKIYQSSLSSIIKLTLGYLGLTNFGLMLGHISLEGSGSIIIFRKFLHNNLNFYKAINFTTIKNLLNKYKKFPIMQLPSQLLLVSSNNLIVFVFSFIFGIETLGFYALAVSLLNAPLNVIGQSVSQVYYAEICSIGKHQPQKIKKLTINVVKKMSLLFFPLLIVVFFGETIFSLIFGNEWQKSGLYAAALCPLVLSRFIASPVMSIFNLYGLQEIQLKISIQRLVVLVILFTLVYLFGLSILHSMLIYSFTMFIFNFHIMYLAFKPFERSYEKI